MPLSTETSAVRGTMTSRVSVFAQLEHRVDHLSFAGLDDLGLLGEVHEIAQLRLGGERAVTIARPRRQNVTDEHE